MAERFRSTRRARRRTVAAQARIWAIVVAVVGGTLVSSAGPAVAGGAGVTRSELPSAADLDLARVVREVEGRRSGRAAGVRNISDGQPISPPAGAPMVQYDPDVAFDGTNFLVVWTTQLPSRNGASTIAATRVTPAGEVLDPNGILVPGTDARHIAAPSVAFGGGGYLVAYENGLNVVSGLRIGTDGVAGAPFTISDGVSSIPGSVSHTETRPAVAHNGTTFLVAWEENDVVGDPSTGTFVTDINIVGTRVDTTGVLDPSGRFISQAAGHQVEPDVASNGSEFLVVWADGRSSTQRDVYGARVDGTGNVLEPDGIAISTGGGNSVRPAVAFGGSIYLVVWTRDTGGIQVRGARVFRDGTPLDTASRNLGGADAIPASPAVAFNGRLFLVVWGNHGGNHVGGTFVSSNWQLTPVGGLRVTGPQIFGTVPAVAVGAGVPFVFWGGNANDDDVWGVRLAPDGAVLDAEARLISTGNLPVGTPAAASVGSGSLVVWREKAGADSQLLATRLLPDGTVLDPQGIVIRDMTELSSTPQGSAPPAVATDGTDYLVAFTGPPSDGPCPVAIGRVSGSGGGTSSGVRIDTDSCATPGVAFDGTNYVVVTAELSGDLQATVVRPAGTVVDSFPVTEGGTGLHPPSAAGVDGTVLVAWRDGATLVGEAGTVTPVVLPPAIPEGDTAVGSDGTGFLLTRMTGGGLVSTRIRADGTVLDPAGIPVSGTGGPPSVAFNRSWLIVWNDRRTTGAGPGVHGARIRPNGTVADPDGFLIAPDATGDPAVSARNDGNGWAVAYPGHDPATRSNRTFARQVAPK